MVRINILSLNVRGLNSSIKRTRVLDLLHRKNIDVAFLQETHLIARDSQRMQNKRYIPITSSSCKSKKKGVTILYKRNSNFIIEHSGSDDDGRIAYCCTLIEGKKFAFVNIYAPNSYDAEFFPNVLKTLLSLQGYSIIIGSDMNAVLDTVLDHSNSSVSVAQSQSSKALRLFTKDLDVCDVWRIHNPTAKEYTYFSPHHKSFSRIDYILISSSLLPGLINIEFLPQSISDHNGIVAQFQINTPCKPSRWRFNTFLLQNEDFITQLRAGLIEFININQNSVSDLDMLWESIKGFLRNNSISFSARLKKNYFEQILTLERKCGELETELGYTFSNDTQQKLKVERAALNDLLRRRAEYLMHITKHKYYIDGSRPSRLLALTLKKHERRFNIQAIKNPKSGLTSNPTVINQTFMSFFERLYISETQPNTDNLNKFFDQLNLNSLSKEEADSLDSEITLEELHKAVLCSNKGKSPGIDGLPIDLYLVMWDQLGPIWLRTINKAISKGHFHKDLNTALITVLPKPGKDHSDCSNYRPISLINDDVKMYAKVIAIRLQSVIHKLIDPDQSGFITGRMASDNIRRVLHIIAESGELKTPSGLLFIDAEKAFDRLEWSYLWFTLKKFNFGDQFINMIKTLYNNPMARVSTGGLMSDTFNICRGTRQGCPLSPLMFNLSIEPLAQFVRQCKNINPIQLGSSIHSISLYADDTLLFLSDIQRSLPNALQIIDEFGALSGFKINHSKTILMPLNSNCFHFSIPNNIQVSTQVKYLGIELRPTLPQISKVNYMSIFEKVEADIQRWMCLPSSPAARMSTIKMNILPRINFISLMLPLPPPVNYWKKLDSLLIKYIWNGKRPRIKWSSLQRNKINGGLGCPNFKLYHWSFILLSVTKWFDPSWQSSWKQIEKERISPIRLQDFLFSGISHRKCTLYYGPILSYTLQIFKKIEACFSSKTLWHTYTPIWHNLNLLSGGQPFVQPSWAVKGILTLNDIKGEDSILDFRDLIEKFNISRNTLFLYFKIRAVLKTHKVPWGKNLQTHPVVKWICNAPNTRIASYFYLCFLNLNADTFPKARAWVSDLNTSNGTIQWDTVWDNTFHASTNPNHQFIHFKVIHRAYLTTRIRHAMGLSPHPFCNFCGPGCLDTLMHMLWDCPDVQQFWDMVLDVVYKVTRIRFPKDPVILLHGFTTLNLYLCLDGRIGYL